MLANGTPYILPVASLPVEVIFFYGLQRLTNYALSRKTTREARLLMLADNTPKSK